MMHKIIPTREEVHLKKKKSPKPWSRCRKKTEEQLEFISGPQLLYFIYKFPTRRPAKKRGFRHLSQAFAKSSFLALHVPLIQGESGGKYGQVSNVESLAARLQE